MNDDQRPAADQTESPAAIGQVPSHEQPAPAQPEPASASRPTGRARPAPRSHRSHRRRQPRRGSVLGEIALVVVLSLALSALIKTFLVQAFYIPSGSMEDTLLVGDRILVNKLAPRFHDITRGDVVVFEDPGGWLMPEDTAQRNGAGRLLHDFFVGIGILPSDTAGDLVKRVIGVGGDHVVCCDKAGRITVNGKALNEPYLYPGNNPSQQPFDVTVPKGMLWVMGDHREVSQDSRAHQGDAHDGMVPVKDVVGRVFVVIWPADRFQRIERPDVFARLNGSG